MGGKQGRVRYCQTALPTSDGIKCGTLLSGANRERLCFMPRRVSMLDDFDRVFNEFFNDLLINRWRRSTEGTPGEHARVIDLPDRYEVRFAATGIEPEKVEIEIDGQRLKVKIPLAPGDQISSSIGFTETIDGQKATANWSNGTLIITLPKQKGRRILLKKS
jgi:HSP20 family molecular chaperone IbpA